MTTPPPPWVAWAPPLDPPTDGALPYDTAEAIAAAYWDQSPHLAAALMWESYAAMLPPTPTVASVATGAQSVVYSPAAAQGEFGLAMQRAEWHRSFIGDELVTAPLVKAPPFYFDPAAGGAWWFWETVDTEPPP